MVDFAIRPYQLEDRPVIYRIAADTAFFGEPVEALLEDRRLFCDGFYRYYVDFEPRQIWVACAGDQVVGFLAGCLDTRTRNRIRALRLLPATVWRIAGGKYRLGPRTRRYALELAREVLGGRIPHADLRAFPAHLHVNVAAEWRGHGLGRRLLATYLDFLRRSGLSGVHLQTTSRNVAASHLYESLGFRLLDERPSSLWTHYVGGPVANRCYGLAFGNQDGQPPVSLPSENDTGVTGISSRQDRDHLCLKAVTDLPPDIGGLSGYLGDVTNASRGLAGTPVYHLATAAAILRWG